MVAEAVAAATQPTLTLLTQPQLQVSNQSHIGAFKAPIFQLTSFSLFSSMPTWSKMAQMIFYCFKILIHKKKLIS